MTLRGKIVLVAGVGPGLGSALVALAAADGATVIAAARTSRALGPIADHARLREWKVVPRVVDVLDPTAAEQLVESTVHEFGRLDAVSIDVGRWVPFTGPLHRLSEAEWTDGVRGNLDAVYRIGRTAFPRLIGQGYGSVVLVSAAPAIRAAAGASYAAAKSGLAELTIKLAREYRSTGVRVNGVLPGSMGHELASLDPPAPEGPVPLTDEVRSSPWEVARAIRYLLSDESRWVTGALLTVDGGISTGGAEPPAAPA